MESNPKEYGSKMRRKKRVTLKATMSFVGIVALSFLIIGFWSTIYSFVGTHRLLVILTSAGILLLLILLGFVSWKKITAKIRDIFN